MEEIQSKSRDNIEREHIFKFAYLNPQYFKIENIFNKNVNQQNIRLAIDTKEDLIRADWIIKNMPNAIDNYKLEDAIDKYFKYEILKRNC